MQTLYMEPFPPAFYLKLFSSKICNTQFFGFIEIRENQKQRNIFVLIAH